MTEEKQESIKEMSFEQAWKLVGEYGEDPKGFAKLFFEAIKKTTLPDDAIIGLLGIAYEQKGLDDYYQETFAEKSEVKHLEEKLGSHQHLPYGKAVLPI